MKKTLPKLSKYCVYKSDPTKTKFYHLDNAATEDEGRTIIWAYFAATVYQNGFRDDKYISLYLFKGSDNIKGRLILSVTVQTKNT